MCAISLRPNADNATRRQSSEHETCTAAMMSEMIVAIHGPAQARPLSLRGKPPAPSTSVVLNEQTSLLSSRPSTPFTRAWRSAAHLHECDCAWLARQALVSPRAASRLQAGKQSRLRLRSLRACAAPSSHANANAPGRSASRPLQDSYAAVVEP